MKFYAGDFYIDEVTDGYSKTGWEESREAYFNLLELGYFENKHNKSDESEQNHLDYVGLGVRSALEFARIFEDTSEDSEERRKRIEAEQNASNLGAIIGIAAGLILNPNDDNSEELPQELEEEQNEIWLQM